MNIGTVVSPYYKLDSIFYYDYLKTIESLQKHCNIILAANLTAKPSYVNGFLRIGFPHLLTTAQNRYMTSLSHMSGIFRMIRSKVETIYDNHMSRKLKEFFRGRDLQILYSFPQYPESYIKNLRTSLSVKVVTELWEDKILHLFDGLRLTSFRKYSKQEVDRGYNWVEDILKTSDRVIVPTTVLKNRLSKIINCPKQISVIPVCQEPLILRDPNYVRSKHDIGSKTILFYLGSLSHYHDLGTLFMSLNKVKSKDVVLLIAGGIEDKTIESYAQILKKLSIPVIYLGRLTKSELEYYISAADICLSIYKFSEPSGFFPASVIKFMLAKKAIIATDLPEIREMFRNEKAGLMVDQNSVDTIAYAIDLLIAHPEERLKLGEKAGKVAKENYLWQHHTEKLIQLFNEII